MMSAEVQNINVLYQISAEKSIQQGGRRGMARNSTRGTVLNQQGDGSKFNNGDGSKC